MEIKQLLQSAVDAKASDLHLISGIPPMLRIEGQLMAIPGTGILTPDILSGLLKQTLTSEQLERLSVNKELDFSLAFSEKGRFRVNVYTQKNSYAAAFRLIPLEIPSIEALGLPTILHSFTTLRQGLVLVTGPTGHGKSTTLAAMLQQINKERATHIVTIEDPVEFVFNPIKSIISQREMRSDTHSWELALR